MISIQLIAELCNERTLQWVYQEVLLQVYIDCFAGVTTEQSRAAAFGLYVKEWLASLDIFLIFNPTIAKSQGQFFFPRARNPPTIRF